VILDERHRSLERVRSVWLDRSRLTRTPELLRARFRNGINFLGAAGHWRAQDEQQARGEKNATGEHPRGFYRGGAPIGLNQSPRTLISRDQMLERGMSVPHVQIVTVEGAAADYRAIWQRANLVLLVLPNAQRAGSYVAPLAARRAELDALHAVALVTSDPVPGVEGPTAVVADRWGEIVYVARATDAAGLPPLDELIEWLRWIEIRCPECEGEAK
jgi:hypothetical protein